MATVSQFRARSRRRTESRGEREGPAFMDDLLTMAGSLANSRKEYAAAQLENLADSVRQFSETMPPLPMMQAYATTAADSLEELANYVVESDVAQMVTDAGDFTRRHPLVTFGGSVAAGLIITQIIHARAQSMRSRSRPRRRGEESGRGRGSDDSEVNGAAESGTEEME